MTTELYDGTKDHLQHAYDCHHMPSESIHRYTLFFLLLISPFFLFFVCGSVLCLLLSKRKHPAPASSTMILFFWQTPCSNASLPVEALFAPSPPIYILPSDLPWCSPPCCRILTNPIYLASLARTFQKPPTTRSLQNGQNGQGVPDFPDVGP